MPLPSEELAAIAKSLYDELDKAIAAEKTAAPFLVKARQSASDAGGHIGAHLSAQPPAPPDLKSQN